MTQISLKLFNKLPFTRNEIEGPSRAGVLDVVLPARPGWRLVERAKNPKTKGVAGDRIGRRRHAAKWCFVKGVCI